MKVSLRKHRFARRQGVALVMALAAIAIATILVVGILALTNRDNLTSRSMANNQKAGLLCQATVEHAMALLDKNIPQPVPPGKSSANPTNWIINPGLLTLVKGSTVTEIPLSSSPSVSYLPQVGDANLNQKNYDGTYPIRGDGTPLKVGWVNVLQNPALAPAADNPIVGRYAFWIDDESAKVNVNMAYGKPDASKINLKNVNPLQQADRTPNQHEAFYYEEVLNAGATPPETNSNSSKTHALPWDGGNAGYGGPTREDRKSQGKFSLRIPTVNTDGTVIPTYYPLWHPSAINLDAVDGRIDRDALASWTHNITNINGNNVYNWRLLNSPQELKKFITPSSSADSAYEDLKFDITTKSRSPDFNVFGKSRLFLENRIPLWEGNQFFQFSYDKDGPVYFHGTETLSSNWNPNINGVQMVADSLSDKLNRNDWPGITGSFVQKWGGDEKALREADQVAWNMVAWGTYAANRYPAYDVDGRSNGGYENSDWQLLDVHDAWSESDTLSVFLQNMAPVGHPQSISSNEFNRRLFRGKLSGKAIMPWMPRPLLSEVALKVQLVDSSGSPVDSTNFATKGSFAIKMSLQVELHQAEGMNPVRLYRTYGFIPTHFEYKASAISGPSAAQNISMPSTPTAWDDDKGSSGGGLQALGGQIRNPTLNFIEPGEYFVLEGNFNYPGGALPNVIFASNHAQFQTSGPWIGWTTPGNAVKFTSPRVTLKDIKFRIAVFSEDKLFGGVNGGRPIYQICPVWDTHDASAVGNAFTPPPGETDYIQIPDFVVDVNDPALLGGGYLQKSAEVLDPRNGLNSSAWKGVANTSGNTLNGPPQPNPEAGSAASKYTYFDFQRTYYNSVSCRPSIGMISVVPIGMQRNIPFATPKFQPGGGGSPPDWLMLDFVAPSMRPHTLMNSTMGKINLNAKLQGGGNAWQADDRVKPLKALLKNLVPDGQLDSVVNNIINHTGGTDFGAVGKYDYIGELCEINGITGIGNDWEKEAIIRNIANLITTQSNTFTVWGVSQTIQKKHGNLNYGVFEAGDVIQSEKRFNSIVERYVWPGQDGVPGNGSVDTLGKYDKTAKGGGNSYFNGSPPVGSLPWLGLPAPKGTGGNALSGPAWPVVDGPDSPTWPSAAAFGDRSLPSGAWGSEGNSNYNSSSLETANNPLRAWMKYRRLDFRFLND